MAAPAADPGSGAGHLSNLPRRNGNFEMREMCFVRERRSRTRDGEQMNSVFLWSILPVLRELPEFGMTSPARSSTPCRPEYCTTQGQSRVARESRLVKHLVVFLVILPRFRPSGLAAPLLGSLPVPKCFRVVLRREAILVPSVSSAPRVCARAAHGDH